MTVTEEQSEVVLVVEDEQVIRGPICRILRKHGYVVLEATNVEDALRVMQEHHSPVHLVITDIMMPEMDGKELVKLLRDWYPKMRVLFMSAYSAQYLPPGEKGMADEFLAKPFPLALLTERVRQILDSPDD